ncbi:PR domain zinc finger protein 10-like [Microplitis mediator]|uniref:PR domain zinc finger protein 10-like n=1 Tax=Microplitis mediator TaxID=375433 RepID=UPI0025538B24|nr:PR domain zinc finger protein 10-like [Microplitis mediator]
MDPRGPQRAGAPINPTTITSAISDVNSAVDKSLLDTVVDDNWHGVGNTAKNNNRLLFLTVEYVDDHQSRDYSKVFSPYEQVSFYSPRAPSPLSDFEHSKVSPLDPNMSSTARYSPTPVQQLPSLAFPNSVVVLPGPPSPLIIPSDGHARANINNYISSHNNTIQNVAQSGDSTTIDFVNNEANGEALVTSVNGELILMQGTSTELESTSSSSSSVSADTAAAGPLMLAEIPEAEFALTREFLVMQDDDHLNVVNSLPNQNCEIKQEQIMITGDNNIIDNHQTELLNLNNGDGVISQEQVLGRILKNNIECKKLIKSIPASGKVTLRKNKKQIRNKTTLECEECISAACLKSGECTCRNVRTISDQPVPSRAVATLPGSYLAINKLPSAVAIGEPIGQSYYGVFAKRNIRQRTQFGPIEGILCPYNGEFLKNNGLPLLYETNDGQLLKVDVSDENTSNWMRFVRPALTFDEQNLVICQQSDGIFFLTTRNILSKEELKAGPSSQYALRRNLTVLQPDSLLKDKEIHQDDSNINGWPYLECSEPFKSSEKLSEPLDAHQGKSEVTEKFDSEQNNSKLSSDDNNKSLKVVDGQTVLYSCSQCPKVFPRSYSLKRHMHMHLGSKAPQKYECSTCGESFLHPYNRSRHIKIFHSDETREKENARENSSDYKCKSCNLAFKKLSLLNIHKLIHEQDVNKEHDGSSTSSLSSACPQCGVAFNAWYDLINHVSSKHGRITLPKVTSSSKANNNNNNQNQNQNQVSTPPMYKCTKCYKRFATKVRLQQHFLVHGAEDQKPLPCNVCCKRFMNNSALSCHLKTHRQDKQLFECPMCRKLFNQVLMLKEHIETHRGEDGIFSCPHCPRTFTKYSVIRKHIRAHHCERKHKCQFCSKPFPTIDKLRMHLLRHSDHREFHCANCGKQFKRKDKLKEHMTRMHNAQKIKRDQIITQNSNNNNDNINNNNNNNNDNDNNSQGKKFVPKVNPTDYNRFIYKCHQCLVGFKRRGMLVNHLAKRHPDVSPDSIPELNLPILRQTRDYYCQYCDKVYKSSSKRKAHIMKNHPGAALPPSNRHQKETDLTDSGLHNSTFSQTVGSVSTIPQSCQWCHKQYASKAKLLQHQRKKHAALLNPADKIPRPRNRSSSQQNNSSLNDNNFIMSDYIQGYDVDTDVDFIKPKILKISEDSNFIDNDDNDDDDNDDDDDDGAGAEGDNDNLELVEQQFIRICDIR